MTVWTERLIGRCLARQIFNNKCLVVVPNCNFTGDEIDILGITRDLRIIDVEIKISRADLKADRRKDKWFTHYDWRTDRAAFGRRDRQPVQWPHRVWKHYFALPEKIYMQELLAELPAASGVLLLRDNYAGIRCLRRAQPCRSADRLSAEDAVNIARLASLRMWDAYKELDAANDRV
jgi:hypothetical protein